MKETGRRAVVAARRPGFSGSAVGLYPAVVGVGSWLRTTPPDTATMIRAAAATALLLRATQVW